MHRALYPLARAKVGRCPGPSVVIMGGQLVKTTEKGGARLRSAQAGEGPQALHSDRPLGPLDRQPSRAGRPVGPASRGKAGGRPLATMPFHPHYHRRCWSLRPEARRRHQPGRRRSGHSPVADGSGELRCRGGDAGGGDHRLQRCPSVIVLGSGNEGEEPQRDRRRILALSLARRNKTEPGGVVTGRRRHCGAPPGSLRAERTNVSDGAVPRRGLFRSASSGGHRMVVAGVLEAALVGLGPLDAASRTQSLAFNVTLQGST